MLIDTAPSTFKWDSHAGKIHPFQIITLKRLFLFLLQHPGQAFTTLFVTKVEMLGHKYTHHWVALISSQQKNYCCFKLTLVKMAPRNANKNCKDVRESRRKAAVEFATQYGVILISIATLYLIAKIIARAIRGSTMRSLTRMHRPADFSDDD